MTKKDIFDLRKKTGLTQEKFAVKIGVTRKTVASWENGANDPSPLALEKLEALRDDHKTKI